MKASERNALFEQLRYDLRMAEGFADEINARGKSIEQSDATALGMKVQKCLNTANKLVEGFNTNAPF